MNLIAKPILLRRLIKKIFGDHAFKYRSKRTQSSSNGGGTSNGGANLFRIHLLEGHLGTKFMSCLSIIIREGSNKGVAETKGKYSSERARSTVVSICIPLPSFRFHCLCRDLLYLKHPSFFNPIYLTLYHTLLLF